jgi:formate hydrogenlyase subunit 6/NADH:ubiquinone oxidoreductase subunit I
MGYFSDINRGVRTTAKGLKLTLKHLWGARNRKISHNIQDPDYFSQPNGHVTLQYPHEKLEIPENGRYQLDIEIDDCIVCDKCAKICPVDCIDIEAIKSPELIRNTSDGSPVRLYAAKFDIDMAKCCFCGLCTTVCPTECLTMNSEYDYSVSEVSMLNFAFSNLSPETAQEKRDLYAQFVKEKEESAISNGQLAMGKVGENAIGNGQLAMGKEAIDNEQEMKSKFEPKEQEVEKPKFVPKFMPKKPEIVEIKQSIVESVEEVAKPKFVPKKPLVPVKQPDIQHPTSDIQNSLKSEVDSEKEEVKPKFVPKKPIPLAKQSDIQHPTSNINTDIQDSTSEIQHLTSDIKTDTQNQTSDIQNKPKFVPKLKPKPKS